MANVPGNSPDAYDNIAPMAEEYESRGSGREPAGYSAVEAFQGKSFQDCEIGCGHSESDLDGSA